MKRVQTTAMVSKVGDDKRRYTIYSFNSSSTRQVERSRPICLRNAGNPYTKDMMWMKRPAEAIAGNELGIEHQTEGSLILKEQTQATKTGPSEQDAPKEPQVWIPSVYRRDILSFLPRTKIENVVRFVSQRWNFVVERYHRMLPRLVFDQLQVHIMGGAEYLVDSDGYASGLSELWGDAFQELKNFHGCCDDIKKPAEQVLTHQLIFPKLRANAVVVLRVEASWRPRTKFAKSAVEFACRNRLTRTTAGDLIHFLSHLDDSAFQRVWVRLDASISAMRSVRGHLNPYIFTVYARATGERLQLNAKVLDVMRWSQARPANAATVRTARQLFSRIGRLSSRFTDENLDWILSLTEQRVYFRDGVEFFEEGDVVFSNAVDRIINHFDLSKASAKSIVPKVHFRLAAQRHQWPAMCPREEASEVVKRRDEWGGEDNGAVHTSYTFRRKNIHTGRPFLVRIETSMDPFGEEGMCALRILHDRCVPAG